MQDAHQNIKVIIADDHPIFRDGLKLALPKKSSPLSIELIASVGNGQELLAAIKKNIPDVVLMDVQMPIMDGIQATLQISQKFPSVKVIAISSFNEVGLILDMVNAGAKGYLLKNLSFNDLRAAITTVFLGGTYFTPETSIHLFNNIESGSAHSFKLRQTLTEREKSIVKLVCAGYCNKEIALKLNLAKRTIDSYRERIMEKIGCKNIIDLFTYAIRTGIHKLQ